MGKTPKSEKRKDPQGGLKERPASAKKKHITGQGTLLNAFKAGERKADLSPSLEQPYSVGLIRNFESTNNDITWVHYEKEICKKRQYVPAMDETRLPGRPVRKSRRNYDDDDTEIPLDKAARLEQDKSLGDDNGYRYICALNELTDSATMPTKCQLARITDMIRNHGLHGRKDLSLQALNFLRRVESFHPAVKVKPGAEQAPAVEINTSAWTFTDCCETFNLDAFPVMDSERRFTPFQVLEHIVSAMHSAIFPLASTGKVAARGTALVSGDLLLLKWILHQFEQDLRCRLEVFASAKKSDKTRALLQNSQLWRTFSDSSLSGQALDQKNMVKKLMEIIAAPNNEDNEDRQQPSSLEELSFNSGQLSDMAGRLLKMLLELYGTAEDAKMFLKHSLSRATTAGAMDNIRMIIEDALLEGFAGASAVLNTLSERTAFIMAIHPKDQLRLLTMLIAVKHAKRKGDHEKYPSLEDYNRLKNEPGSVDSYLVAQPLEALSYVLEDTNYAYNIIDKTGDGLALLVTSICRAASQESSGSRLTDMSLMMGKIVKVLMDNRPSDGKNSVKQLSPESIMSLRAAQFAVKAC